MAMRISNMRDHLTKIALLPGATWEAFRVRLLSIVAKPSFLGWFRLAA